MAQITADTRKNVFDSKAPTKYCDFVRSHRDTLDYLSQWGSLTERAKVAVIFSLANKEQEALN